MNVEIVKLVTGTARGHCPRAVPVTFFTLFIY